MNLLEKQDFMSYLKFNKYVLRSPLLSMESIDDMTSEKLKNICSIPYVNEAIYLASPEFHSEIRKYQNAKIEAGKEVDKLEYTLLKYLSRMSHRCTPFGLFAGCAVGVFGDISKINLDKIENHQRHTRLDMNYLCALSQDFNKDVNLRDTFRYYPNTSLYPAGNQLRYVEYRYTKSNRNHFIVAIDNSEYVSKILNMASKGCTIKEMVNTLSDDEISFDNAKDFIHELIDNQILVSELEPSITGNEFMSQMMLKCGNVSKVHNTLKNVETKLKKIDNSTFGESLLVYDEISKDLNEFQTSYDKKYLFQTDQVVSVRSNVLNKKIIDEVWEGIQVLNKLSWSNENSNLKSFQDAFYERYEEEEVPLSQALDVEFGIGYIQNGVKGNGDISSLIDDLVLPNQGRQNTQMNWNRVLDMLSGKYAHAIARSECEIQLTDKDLDLIPAKRLRLAPTFSAMVEVVGVDKLGKNKIRITDVGGSSAANYLGRFCHADTKMNNYVQEMMSVEDKFANGSIVAEITHLPESRTGNILLRPNLRRYDIPYLANSTLKQEYQISINDLMVSVKGNRILLRSKRLNREVIPRMTTAHNYTFNSLPVYHFLCDMQMQGMDDWVAFDWGTYSDTKFFLPRVSYKNLILSPSTWNLNRKNINSLFELIKTDKNLVSNCKEWRDNLDIPNKILVIDGDNELFIDLTNELFIKMFIDILKNKKGIKIQEFLYGVDNNLVRRGDETFTNQIICSFHRQYEYG